MFHLLSSKLQFLRLTTPKDVNFLVLKAAMDDSSTKTLELNFLPSLIGSFCVIYPYLFAGKTDPPDETSTYYAVITEENENGSLRDITAVANTISRRIENEYGVFFRFEKSSKSSFPTLACVLRRILKLTPEESIKYIKSTALSGEITWTPTKDQIWMIKNYRPPIRVLFCGDRNTAVCFEEVILYELKALPEDSVMVHGGCKGVDLFAEELAKHLGIATKAFGITSEEWSRIGPSAGPKRNQKMLDECISYVVAFHPDISMSKGTRDMMVRAWKAGVPVYIHDLKRKSKFEGDFDVL